MKKHFKYNAIFPYEAFVQNAIETFFQEQGFAIIDDSQVDLIAQKQNEKWLVEAKGETSATGTDFNTALGQLVKKMSSKEAIYAIAVPKTPKYQRQCNLLSKYVRELLLLHILVIDQDGKTAVIEPNQPIDNYFM